MGDAGAGLGSGQGCASCIGKEVKDLNRSCGLPYPVTEPVPVGGLFREQSCVLEAEGLQVKCKPLVSNGPLLR